MSRVIIFFLTTSILLGFNLSTIALVLPQVRGGEALLDNLGQPTPPTAPATNKLVSKPLTKLPNKLAVTPIEKKPGAIVIPRENCGDYHTGWVDVPNADVNPCPKSCQRGEQQSVNLHPGDTPLYDALYHCYLPEMVVNQTPEVIKQLEEGAPPRENCGTYWTNRVDDPNADVNPCPKDCERGELRSAKRVLKGDVLQYDLNYQCYVAEPTAAVPVARAITIPNLTIIGSGPTVKVMVPTLTLTGSGPTANVAVPDMIIMGAGPTSNVAVDAMSLTGSGPTSSIIVQAMSITGAGPTAFVVVPSMSLIGLKPINIKVIPP